MTVVPQRIQRRIRVQDDGCWIWDGVVRSNGYGIVWLNGRQYFAHRAVYELLVGPIPDGLTLDHLCHGHDESCPGGPCRHRSCCNPAHLEPATAAEQQRRSKPATKTHCVHGHNYGEGNNTAFTPSGRRYCRECRRIRARILRGRRVSEVSGWTTELQSVTA